MDESQSDQGALIRIGVSACLLGQQVRYDGDHKHDRYLTDTLGPFFEWVPVCPEVELGLGTPRETIQLVQRNDDIRLCTTRTQVDLTDRMRQYESTFMRALTRIATTRKNVNVLQHMLGYFREQLDAVSRQELAGHIEDYQRQLVPLVVPLTLVRHYVRLLDIEYLRDQVYLNPHPKVLALRNHV